MGYKEEYKQTLADKNTLAENRTERKRLEKAIETFEADFVKAREDYDAYILAGDTLLNERESAKRKYNRAIEKYKILKEHVVELIVNVD